MTKYINQNKTKDILDIFNRKINNPVCVISFFSNKIKRDDLLLNQIVLNLKYSLTIFYV